VAEFSGNANAADCIACTPGRFQNVTAGAQCTRCLPASPMHWTGFYMNRTLHGSSSASDCVECPLGRITEEFASTTCDETVCPSNTTGTNIWTSGCVCKIWSLNARSCDHIMITIL
jgi:hypothetical protein